MSPTDSCSFHHRVLYLICAAFNILLGGFCSPEDSINETDWSPDPIKRIFLYTISQIRYRLRYRSKLRRRTKLQTVSELRTLPSNHKNEETIVHTFKSMPESRDERCSIFLNYGLLMLIVRELHFVDVINLSLASMGLRDALLPKTDIAARTQALRSHTCGGCRSECSICGIQICPVRQYERVTRSLLIR